MTRVRGIAVSVVYLLLVSFLAAGCQSVATTSAKLRNEEGNYEIAIDLAKQAIAQNPNDAEAYFQLGVAYSNLDSVALAHDAFVKAMELDPKKAKDAKNNIQHNFAKHYKLGQGAFRRDDYETAATEFEKAVQANPKEAVAHYNLGVTYTKLAKADPTYYDRAIAAFDKVFELSAPGESYYLKALNAAGRAFVATGREKEAADRFRRIVEEDPTNYAVIENLGNDMLNQRQYAGAVVFLKLAAEARAKISAEDFTLYYNIGTALYQTRKENPEALDESIEYYKRALDLQPDEPQTLFNIIVAYVAKEDWQTAAEWGERYTNLRSADYRGWQLLARCYSELGEKEKARDAMKRFEQLRQAGGQ